MFLMSKKKLCQKNAPATDRALSTSAPLFTTPNLTKSRQRVCLSLTFFSKKLVRNFIGAYNTGKGDSGRAFVEYFASSTNSLTIASQHEIIAGYKYDGGRGLEGKGFNSIDALLGSNIDNGYTVSRSGETALCVSQHICYETDVCPETVTCANTFGVY